MMSILNQTSWLYSSKTHPHSKSTQFKPLRITVFALDKNNNSQEEPLPDKPTSSDRIKLAFQNANNYKKSLVLNDAQKSTPLSKDVPSGNTLLGDVVVGKDDIPEVVPLATEKAGTDPMDKGIVNNDTSIADLKDISEDKVDGKEEVPEALRIAMEKAREYRKNKGKVDDDKSLKESDQFRGDVGGGEAEVPESVRIALGKASEYKKNKCVPTSSSQENMNLTGLIGGGASNSKDETTEKKANKKEGLKVSSMDFVGLGFSDKKISRGLPAGLVPVADPFPEGDFQDVEMIVGDASMFGNATSSETDEKSEESSDIYKPKVSTWGVFPRPSNISKTFGGGKTIRPGEELETAEDKAAKQARTKQLLAAYKRKMGLNMDPKLKAECEKALNDGDFLMDRGRLQQALPYYQQVMDNLPFQTELHGLAALQWSICQDSLNRSSEARSMYEKLQSHPNVPVSKKARQFMFSFKAMEMMKVTQSTASPKSTDYGSYFEAFIEDKENITPASVDVKEDPVSQAFPYIIFLATPILLVLLAAARKGM